MNKSSTIRQRKINCFTLFFSCLLLSLSGDLFAQVINDNINYQVKFTGAFWGKNSDPQGLFGIQDIVSGKEEPTFLIKAADDKNGRYDELMGYDWDEPAGQTVCHYWDAEASTSNWSTGFAKEVLTKINSSSKAFDLEVQSFENDCGDRCVGNRCVGSQDQDFARSLLWIQPKEKQREPGQWTYIEENQDNGGKFRYKFAWRYTNGDSFWAPLDFGVIGANQTKTHFNSNRIAPNGANAQTGYYDYWQADQGFEASPDVTYSFTISGSSKTVVVSTNNSGTDFDTYISLIRLDPNVEGRYYKVAENDNFADGEFTSVISADLCPGIYQVIVEGDHIEGFHTASGNFKLSISATNFYMDGGVVSQPVSAQCQGANLPSINNTRNAQGIGAITYSWEKKIGSYWYPLSGENNSYLSNPGQMGAQTLRFRRKAEDCGGYKYSNEIVFQLKPSSATGGSLSLDGSAIVPSGSSPGRILSVADAVASPSPTTVFWEKKVGSGNWTRIANATSQTYAIPALMQTTHFRRGVVNDCGKTAYSNSISITVIAPNGVITGKVQDASGAGMGNVLVCAERISEVPGSDRGKRYCATTNSVGGYTIEKIYYGDNSADFTVTASQGNLSFSPSSITRTLRATAPAYHDLNFVLNESLSVSPQDQVVEADAGSLTFNVSANTNWTVASGAAWLNVNPSTGSQNGSFTATYTENTSVSMRETTITVQTAGGESQTRKIKQHGREVVDASSGLGSGLRGAYYHNADFTSTAFSRIDESIDFNWTHEAPVASMEPETFTVRWEGEIEAGYSEEYTFYTTTDDGVRLWVDDQLIIDKWIPQAPTQWSGSIALNAGQKVAVKMEYYEAYGGAVAQLAWSSASQAKQIIPRRNLFPAPQKATCPDMLNPGLYFDGQNDYVEVPFSAANNTANFTAEAWVYPTAAPGFYASVITSRNSYPLGSGNAGYILYRTPDDKWSFWMGGGSTIWNTLNAASAVQMNTWTHLAATFDGTKMRLYVNGRLEGEATPVSPMLNTEHPLRIGGGATEDSPQYFFGGAIDEVRIWNRARSESELQATAAMELAGMEPGLTAYYTFNEGDPQGNNTEVRQVENKMNANLNGALVNMQRSGSVSNWGAGAPVQFHDSDGDGIGDPCETPETPNCQILSAGLTVSACFDNGTADPMDDYYRYSLQPSGVGVGQYYGVQYGDEALGGANYYNIRITYDRIPISRGVLNLTLIDENNADCQLKVTINPPTPCSQALSSDFCEDFNSYAEGGVSAQSERWVKWSDFSSDAAVTSAGSSDGGKSLKIQYDAFLNHQPNVLLKLGDLNTGDYDLSWKMYVPSGKTACFNAQKFQNTPGREKGFQIVFGSQGVAELKVGNTSARFNYQQNRWIDIKLSYELDEDKITLYVDERGLFYWMVSSVYASQGSAIQLGALNFYAFTNTLFYIDEFCLTEVKNTQMNKSRSTAQSLEEVNQTKDNELAAGFGGDLETDALIKTNVKLGQNYPNPVSVSTTIPLTIPQETQKAFVQITDMSGKVLAMIPAEDRGDVRLFFSADHLTPGVYFYSLIVDGKWIDTKRMSVVR